MFETFFIIKNYSLEVGEDSIVISGNVGLS